MIEDEMRPDGEGCALGAPSWSGSLRSPEIEKFFESRTFWSMMLDDVG